MKKIIWLSIVVASTLSASSFTDVKVSNNDTAYQLSIQGSLKGHIMFYMDSDNNPDTGYSFGDIKGADYKVELEDVTQSREGDTWQNRVYHYEGDSSRVWENWREKPSSDYLTSSSVNDHHINLSLKKSAFSFASGSHYSVHMVSQKNWSLVEDRYMDKTFEATEQSPSTDSLTLPKGGFSKLQLYINSDNNEQTGLSFSSVKGADFMIELSSLERQTGERAWENRLYKYKGGSSWDVWENIKENDLDNASLIKVDNKNITLNLKNILQGQASLDHATSYIVKRDSGWNLLSVNKVESTPEKEQTPNSSTATLNKEGFEKLQFYIDSDNNPNSGYSGSHVKGAEYLLELTSLEDTTGHRDWQNSLYRFNVGKSSWSEMWSKVSSPLDSQDKVDVSASSIKVNFENILDNLSSNFTYYTLKRDSSWKILEVKKHQSAPLDDLKTIEKKLNAAFLKEQKRQEQKDHPIGGAKLSVIKLYHDLGEGLYVASLNRFNGNGSSEAFGFYRLEGEKDFFEKTLHHYYSSAGVAYGDKASHISVTNETLTYDITTKLGDTGETTSKSVPLSIENIMIAHHIYDAQRKAFRTRPHKDEKSKYPVSYMVIKKLTDNLVLLERSTGFFDTTTARWVYDFKTHSLKKSLAYMNESSGMGTIATIINVDSVKSTITYVKTDGYRESFSLLVYDYLNNTSRSLYEKSTHEVADVTHNKENKTVSFSYTENYVDKKIITVDYQTGQIVK